MEVTKEQWVVTKWTTYQPLDAGAAERKRRQRAKEKGDNTVTFPAAK
jgi:hypothetical protein